MGPNLARTNQVMPALVAGIHAFLSAILVKSWMAGTGPAMTAARLWR
jgi:hypothetical protein